ncbi:MAG: flagellar biosynthesis anti-sigma factor FlgM [Betaproteobacteria bacterium TMED82]|nr:MAG: flagellar biosynthesis anti-sigma factor FlgM [Betaproteobacteria bacterium TMED82]|tara:strand:+ start:180786 stop:181085 length:300 start_codon:yes stop_codon:yes gene_type:complete
MSEPVNSLLKTLQPDRPNGPNPRQAADEPVSRQQAPAPKDEVILSDVARKALENEPSFDREKVKQIRQAIEEGNYPLNSRKIAESFVAMESLIGNVRDQ